MRTRPASHRPNARRGIAVLLALVAVGMAVVLGLALSSTRDTAVTTSDSLVRTATVRASAAGGYDVAVAMLAQYPDLAAGDGTESTLALWQPVQIGRATIEASLVDPETGMSPTARSLAVDMLVNSTVEGVTQSVRGMGRIPWASNVARADLDLSEFALLAANGIDAHGGAVIGVWKTAPLAALAEPIAIGTLSREPVSFDSTVAANGYVIAKPGEFASSQAALEDGIAEKGTTIPTVINAPRVPFPAEPGSATVVNASDMEAVAGALGGGDASGDNVSSDLVINGSISVTSPLAIAGAVTSGSWRTVVVEGDLALTGASVKVSVPTQIIVHGDLTITGTSSIELATGSPLSIYAGGTTTVDQGSYIGAARTASTTESTALDNRGTAAYSSTRATIYAADAEAMVVVSGGSVLKGEIYAPDSTVEINGTGTVYGRVLGASIALDGGRVFYDPALNSGRGWLNPESGLWEAPNVLRAEVREVALLDDASLGAFAQATGVAVETGGVIVATAHVDAAGGVDRTREVVDAVSVLSSAEMASLDLVASAPKTTDTPIEIIAEPQPGQIGGQQPDQSLGSTGETTADSVEAAIVSPIAPDPPRALTSADPAEFTLVGTVRDFRGANENGGHPDFASQDLGGGKVWHLVEATLSSDGKPQLSDHKPRLAATDYRTAGGLPISWTAFSPELGDIAGTDGAAVKNPIGGKGRFQWWFRDKDGMNIAEPAKIVFQRGTDGEGRIRYLFDSTALPGGGYYPIDGRLLGNPRDKATKTAAEHNTSFTLEFSAVLTYRAIEKQTISFGASDDLWVFVDGVLAVDLGGMGELREQALLVSRLAASLGWSDNSRHDVRIFAANRSKLESYLRIATNFAMEPGEPPKFTVPDSYLAELKERDERAESDERQGAYVTSAQTQVRTVASFKPKGSR